VRRLLVYGGNQHGERRRIGAWPNDMGSQVFQDTYGSSMRSASFGVGILDHAPILILRKIENFGERAYPLAVLLDPGRETWERFKWNGAHLLWSLFGKIDYPGIKLLTEPESYHTDEHLEKLLSEVDESIPPQSDSEEITDPEHLLDLWSGAVFSKIPLIAQVDPQLMGFSSRPDLKGLSDLLSKLPESLRCGQGWLFGGRDRHAESLGAHLVFDDGKLDPPSDEDRKLLVDYQSQGNQLRTALERLNQNNNDENSPLKEFLSTPVFEWTAAGVETLPELLDDLLLLDELNDRPEHQIMPPIDDDKRFTRINERVEQDGQLNKDIIAAANRFLSQHERKRTEAETIFILNQAVQTKSKIKEKELGNLNENASSSFFVSKRIYPADATDWMQRDIRFKVSQKLIETENQFENIPEIFLKEAKLSPGYKAQDLESLLDTAVQRSAEKEDGLPFWSTLFEHPKIGENVQKAVRTAVLHRVNLDYPHSLIDYLIIGNDSGGKQLMTQKPAFKDIQTLETLVQFITEQRDSRNPRLETAAKQWLNELAKSELRPEISLKQKDQIAGHLEHGWESYKYARRAFQGDPHLSPLSKIPDEQEQRYMVQELAAAATDKSAGDYTPNLKYLAKLLAPDYLGAMIEALVDMRPYFDGRDALSWVEGWSRLAQDKKLDEIHRSMCLDKHRTELVRLILETNKALKGRDQLEVLRPENLTLLFRGLLIEGGIENDGFGRKRLVEVLNTLGTSKDANRSFQSVVEDVLSNGSEHEQLTRRFLKQHEALSVIKVPLTKEQQQRLDALFEDKNREAVESIKNSLLVIFSSGERGSAAFDFIGRVNQTAMKSGDDVFKKALTEALEEMAADKLKKDLFLSGGASNSECFQFFRKVLTQPQSKKLLTQLESERKLRQRIATIKQSILEGGGPDTDKQCQKSLSTILEDYPDDATRDTLSQAMKKALGADESFRVLIRRFVRIGSITISGQQSFVMSPDKLFNDLFENLTPETGREFLGALWKHYEAKYGDNSPILHAACKDLKTLEHSKNARKKQGSRKKGAGSNLYLDPFDRRLLNFLAHNSTLRKHAAQLEFGTDKVDSIEKLLRDFDSDFKEDDEIEVETTESSRSLGSKFIGLFIKRSGSKT
jgi:hypothetical protein